MGLERRDKILETMSKTRALLYSKDHSVAPSKETFAGWMALLDRLSNAELEMLVSDESKLKRYLPDKCSIHEVLPAGTYQVSGGVTLGEIFKNCFSMFIIDPIRELILKIWKMGICEIGWYLSRLLSGKKGKLIAAAEAGDINRVRALLEMGVDPNSMRRRDGKTPLAASTIAGNSEVVSTLLKAHADPNMQTGPDRSLSWGDELTGRTPLYLAASDGRVGVVEALLQAGADPNGSKEIRPIHWAIQENYIDVVTELLRAGADLTVEDNWYHTPLMRAADCERLEILELLLKAGADPNARNSKGETALMVAAGQESETNDIVKFLLKVGADPNASDSEGYTPLMCAVIEHETKRPDVEVVNILLKAGADPNATNRAGETVLMCAANYPEPQIDIFRSLLRAGADNVKAKDNSGKTVLDRLAYLTGDDNADIVDMLSDQSI